MSRSGRSPDELEELEEGAIIAHQAAPHSPQRRAQVADESRSVVIAEDAQPASKPYRHDRGEATVVIRDRRDLERARRQILAEIAGKRGGVPRAVWFGLLFAAVAITGSLAVVWARAPRGAEVTQVVAPVEMAAEAKPKLAPTPSAAAVHSELPTPQISLEELPLERPRRRQ